MPAGADHFLPPAVFLGFCVKESWVPPDQWWGAPWVSHVREVCSASDCLASRPPDWEERWDFNRASCWDTEALARAHVPPEQQARFHTYAYRAIPLVFDGTDPPSIIARDELFLPGLPPLPSEPALPAYQCLGYDVVQYAGYLNYGCSPLSCNGMGAEHPVNAYCLLDSAQAAYAAAQAFARDEPEPGPFLIFEIWRGDV